MASFACKTLLLTQADQTLTVTLNRPEVRNAFNSELIDDLQRLADWIDTQKDLRLVFLNGSGKVFCAGGDLNWMGESIQWNREQNYRDAEKLSAMFNALNQLEKPLVGLIHGGAYGGGVGLVSVCDHVVCDEEVVFSLSEVRLGLIPACIGPFVLDKVGSGNCRSLFISGERFGAKKALAIGLVHELVKGQTDMNAAKARISESLRVCGPHAMKTAKRFLREIKNMDAPEANRLAAHTLADLRIGEEAQEGIRAFLDKRKPKWA